MTLYLIRHTHAGEGDPENLDDHLRPLSRKGQRQAETLARALVSLGLRFDRLFTSPYARATETATPLTPHVRSGRLELLAELTSEDYALLLETLHSTLKSADTTVGLVGHEPYLSGLMSYLLSGDVGRVRTHFRKGMMVGLGGTLKPGRMELRSALSPTVLKELGR